jgi:hypothetical protein
MENKEDDIENLFRERFAEDEADVSPRVWQNISSTLPLTNSGTSHSGLAKTIAGSGFTKTILLWGITSVVVLSASIGSYLHFTRKQSVSSISYQEKALTTTTTENILGNESNKDNLIDPSHPAPINDSSTLAFNTSTIKQQNKNISGAGLSQASVFKNNRIVNKKEIKHLRSNASVHLSNTTVKQTKDKNTSHILTASSEENKNIKNTNQISGDSHSIGEDALVSKFLLSKKETRHNRNNNLSLKDNIDSLKSVQEQTPVIVNSDKNNSITKVDSAFAQKERNNSIHGFENKTTTTSAETNLSNTTSEIIDQNRTAATDSVSINSLIEKQVAITKNSDLHLPTDSSSNANAADINALPRSSLKKEVSSFPNTRIDADSLLLKGDSLTRASLITSDTIKNKDLTSLDTLVHTAKDSVLTNADVKKEKIKSTLFNRLTIDGAAAILLTGASTKATDDVYQSAVANKNGNDKSSLGYLAGVLINYKLSNRIHLSTGLVYTSFSEQYRFNNYVENQDTTFSYVDIKKTDQYSFISIPLQLSYAFFTKEKLCLSATAGFRSNILLKGVTYLPNASNTDVVEVKSGFNSISFSYLVALEAEYKLSEHAALLIQPTFLYGASSIHSKASALNQKPYGVGLIIGLRFTF